MILSANPKVVIVNYDILQYWAKLIKKLNPKLIVLDEIQNIKNMEAIRTKAAMWLCEGVPHIIGTSATPLLSRPLELFPALHIIRPDLFPSFKRYVKRYCSPKFKYGRWDYRGSSNLPELHRKLKKHLMIRRTEKVLKDLPGKKREIKLIKLKNFTDYYDEEQSFIKWLQLQNIWKGKLKKDAKLQALVLMGHMIRKAALLKLPSVIKDVDKIIESGNDKIILFAIHRKVINALRDHYGDACVVIDGLTPQSNRQVHIDQFTKLKRVRVMIAQLKAGGSGWNGQVASVIGIVEFPYVPAMLTQAEGRGYRMGQTKNLRVIYFVAQKTIEDRVLKINDQKQKNIDTILDGGVSSQFDVYDKLIQEYIEMGEDL
jgi:SNF2 family DNA or RNA helicase